MNMRPGEVIRRETSRGEEKRYRLERFLGQGATSVVWLVTDMTTEQKIVLKEVHHGLEEQWEQAFEDEIQVMQLLWGEEEKLGDGLHAVPRIYDKSRREARPLWMTMEYVVAPPVEEFVRGKSNLPRLERLSEKIERSLRDWTTAAQEGIPPDVRHTFEEFVKQARKIQGEIARRVEAERQQAEQARGLHEADIVEIGWQTCRVLHLLHNNLGRAYKDFQLKNIRWDPEKRQVKILDWNVVTSEGTVDLRHGKGQGLVDADLEQFARYLFWMTTLTYPPRGGASPAMLARLGGARWCEQTTRGLRYVLERALDPDPSRRYRKAYDSQRMEVNDSSQQMTSALENLSTLGEALQWLANVWDIRFSLARGSEGISKLFQMPARVEHFIEDTNLESARSLLEITRAILSEGSERIPKQAREQVLEEVEKVERALQAHERDRSETNRRSAPDLIHAVSLFRAGEVKQALDVVEEICRKTPEDFVAQRWRHVLKVAHRARIYPPDPVWKEALLEKLIQALESEDWARAEQAFSRLQEVDAPFSQHLRFLEVECQLGRRVSEAEILWPAVQAYFEDALPEQGREPAVLEDFRKTVEEIEKSLSNLPSSSFISRLSEKKWGERLEKWRESLREHREREQRIQETISQFCKDVREANWNPSKWSDVRGRLLTASPQVRALLVKEGLKLVEEFLAKGKDHLPAARVLIDLLRRYGSDVPTVTEDVYWYARGLNAWQCAQGARHLDAVLACAESIEWQKIPLLRNGIGKSLLTAWSKGEYEWHDVNTIEKFCALLQKSGMNVLDVQRAIYKNIEKKIGLWAKERNIDALVHLYKEIQQRSSNVAGTQHKRMHDLLSGSCRDFQRTMNSLLPKIEEKINLVVRDLVDQAINAGTKADLEDVKSWIGNAEKVLEKRNFDSERKRIADILSGYYEWEADRLLASAMTWDAVIQYVKEAEEKYSKAIKEYRRRGDREALQRVERKRRLTQQANIDEVKSCVEEVRWDIKKLKAFLDVYYKDGPSGDLPLRPPRANELLAKLSILKQYEAFGVVKQVLWEGRAILRKFGLLEEQNDDHASSLVESAEDILKRPPQKQQDWNPDGLEAWCQNAEWALETASRLKISFEPHTQEKLYQNLCEILEHLSKKWVARVQNTVDGRQRWRYAACIAQINALVGKIEISWIQNSWDRSGKVKSGMWEIDTSALPPYRNSDLSGKEIPSGSAWQDDRLQETANPRQQGSSFRNVEDLLVWLKTQRGRPWFEVAADLYGVPPKRGKWKSFVVSAISIVLMLIVGLFMIIWIANNGRQNQGAPGVTPTPTTIAIGGAVEQPFPTFTVAPTRTPEPPSASPTVQTRSKEGRALMNELLEPSPTLSMTTQSVFTVTAAPVQFVGEGQITPPFTETTDTLALAADLRPIDAQTTSMLVLRGEGPLDSGRALELRADIIGGKVLSPTVQFTGTGILTRTAQSDVVMTTVPLTVTFTPARTLVVTGTVSSTPSITPTRKLTATLQQKGVRLEGHGALVSVPSPFELRGMELKVGLRPPEGRSAITPTLVISGTLAPTSQELALNGLLVGMGGLQQEDVLQGKGVLRLETPVMVTTTLAAIETLVITVAMTP